MPLSTTSSAMNSLNSLSSQFGMSFSTPGVGWGLALGKDLHSLNAPLLDDVPYFYMRSDSGATASLGNMSVSTPGSHTMEVVFDPGDPMVYVSYDDYAGGVSFHGDLPYVPNLLPTGQSDPGIFGQIYAAGSVDLGELPVSLSGSMVLNLDANHDGHYLGLSNNSQLNGSLIGNLLTGNTSVSQLAANAINDIQIGFNGDVSVSSDEYGIPVDLKVGTGSAYYVPASGNIPGVLAFHGQSTNPFEGVPVLENLKPTTYYDFQGYLQTNKQWGFSLNATNNQLFGYPMSSISLSASSADSSLEVSASMGGLLGLGQVELDGSIDWATKTVALHGSADFSLDAVVVTLQAHADFNFSVSAGQVTFGIGFNTYFQTGSDSNNWHLGTKGYFELSSDWMSDGFNLQAEAYTGVTSFGKTKDTDLFSFGINQYGFNVDIAGYQLDVTF
jgi:hypothetical protein